MASSRQTTGPSRKAGMWSTITDAVQAGWGPTGRLLTVFAVLGVLAVGFAVAASDSGIAIALRALLAVAQ